MALMMRLHVLASSGLAAAFWVIGRYFGKAAQRPLSPTADIRQGERHVCFGPFPDSRTAANHASQQLRDRGSPNNPITTPNSWHSRAGVRAVHRIETRPASYGSYWMRPLKSTGRDLAALSFGLRRSLGDLHRRFVVSVEISD